MIQDPVEEIAENHLQCSICFELLKRPKVLECQHSFCAACLQDMVRSTETVRGRKQLLCPQCRHPTHISDRRGVDALKDNFELASLVATVQKFRDAPVARVGTAGSEKLQCDTCVMGEQPSFLCKKCDLLLCEMCCAKHRSDPTSSNHEVQGHKDQLCNVHLNQRMRFFCHDCQLCVCSLCRLVKHRGHKYELIDDTVHEFSEKLWQLLNQLRTHKEKLKRMADQLQDAQMSVNNAHKAIIEWSQNLQISSAESEELKRKLLIKLQEFNHNADLDKSRKQLHKLEELNSDVGSLLRSANDAELLLQAAGWLRQLRSVIDSLLASGDDAASGPLFFVKFLPQLPPQRSSIVLTYFL